MADVSIITLTRNHPEYVERVSDSLDAQVDVDHLKVQRILVNNGPRKGRRTWDESTRLGIKRGWAVIEPGYNTSFSEGNNMGFKAAQGEYVFLLNDDMVLEPEALGRLWACREKAHLLGMLIMDTDGTVNHAGTALWPSSHHVGRFDPRELHEEPAVYLREAITFAAAFMPAWLYTEMGGLDERYIYGWEDTDFSCRVLDAGYTIGVCMDAVGLHGECGTRVRGDGGYYKNNSALFHTDWTKPRLQALLKRYWDGRDRNAAV